MGLWLKQDDGSLVPVGGGGGGGPHDHDDYLPLAGGTVRGDLTVERGDLTVDGNAKLSINVPSDYRYGYIEGAGYVFIEHVGFIGRTLGGPLAVACNGYPNMDLEWTSMEIEDRDGPLYGATQIDLQPTGRFDVRVASNHPTGSDLSPDARFTVTESGPTFRAMPSTCTVDDVLERAETAEFPPEDDEGVAMMDGYDEVPLFEVVSALLAKIKELSARIETLEGN